MSYLTDAAVEAKANLIIQVTHPALGQEVCGLRGGGREPVSRWCTALVPCSAAGGAVAQLRPPSGRCVN